MRMPPVPNPVTCWFAYVFSVLFLCRGEALAVDFVTVAMLRFSILFVTYLSG